MLFAKDARRLTATAFPGKTLVDVTSKFTRANSASILQEAVEHSTNNNLFIVRHTKNTHWLFRHGSDVYACDCVLIYAGVVVKVNSADVDKVRATISRFDRDESTACCVCFDENVESGFNPQVVLGYILTNCVGVCCSRCGNYTCNVCLDRYCDVYGCTMGACPVCQNKLEFHASK